MRLLSICMVLLLTTVKVLRAQTSTPLPTSPNLSAIAFLTKHEWEAQLPDEQDGKKREIHAKFTWSQNGQAIRISNQFLTDGQPRPYLDGLYTWDPQRRAIVFWYVDAEGTLTKGEVKTEDGKLIHEFEQVTSDGKSTTYVAKVTRHAEEAWDNEIFERRGTELKAIVNVRYEGAEKANK